jgi:hypothetical protein
MIPELPYKVENMLIEKHIYDDGTFKTWNTMLETDIQGDSYIQTIEEYFIKHGRDFGAYLEKIWS